MTTHSSVPFLRSLSLCVLAMTWITASSCECWAEGTVSPSVATIVQTVQPKMVKIYGAGGLEGLEAYQSGCFISATGHILTSWSYVLDASQVTVVLNDGRKLEGSLVGMDPRLDIAVLKVDINSNDFFDISSAAEANPGQRVLAFSNLYGIAAGNEPTSVLHGVVSAVAELSARRGVFPSPYQGRVFVLDAVTNNAGAAGGALTDYRGRFLGLLGKELRNSSDDTWLNYALPASELREPVQAILEGKTTNSSAQQARATAQKPVTVRDLGLVLVPNVLVKTPPFVEFLRPESPATRAGVQVDDLIVMVNGQAVQSQADLYSELSTIEAGDAFKVVVLRNQVLQELEIQSVDE